MAPHLARRTFLVQLCLVLALALAALASFPVPHTSAATLTVTNGNDSGPGSLRATLAAAAPGDTITFAAGITTVTLTSSQLTITKLVTIQGSGLGGVTIRRSTAAGTPEFRIFSVSPGVGAIFRGLTISNGRATTSGGGGILNDRGSVSLDSSVVDGNSSANGLPGGGIASVASGNGTHASIDLFNSYLTNNNSGQMGGGLASQATGGANVSAVLRDSTVSNNIAGTTGAISSYTIGANGFAYLGIARSTISGNTGGALFCYATEPGTLGQISIIESTISGNAGSGGQFIALGGASTTATLLNSTISGTTGPGIAATAGAGPSQIALALTHATFADNVNSGGNGHHLAANGPIAISYRGTLFAAGPAIPIGSFFSLAGGATTSSLSYNLSQRDLPGANSNDLVNTNPQLGPLAANGGLTRTHLPAATSPALNRIPASRCSSVNDQRGIARPQQGACDIGSVERTAP